MEVTRAAHNVHPLSGVFPAENTTCTPSCSSVRASTCVFCSVLRAVGLSSASDRLTPAGSRTRNDIGHSVSAAGRKLSIVTPRFSCGPQKVSPATGGWYMYCP